MSFQKISAENIPNLSLELTKNGQSEYQILLSENPTPVQESAAEELRSVLKQMTSADIPIIKESDSNSEQYSGSLQEAAAEKTENTNKKSELRRIVIGPSKTSDMLLKTLNIDESSIGYDGIIVQTVGKNIILSGHPQRGPIYAVNSFLEQLGCRWWTSSESFIPVCPNGTLILNDPAQFSVVYVPPLIYRESFYRDSFNGPFAVKLKCNGNSANIADNWGGHHQFQFFVHSFQPLIPQEKYFKDHLDWFPEINGVRKVGIPNWAGCSEEQKAFFATLQPEQICESGVQLCLTNDEMRKELVKNALIALEKNPNASFISISQNDWQGYCTCEKCAKIAEEEDAQSGVLIRFVNQVAEEIEKTHPNIFVETLAYQYTRKPPKLTRPRKNVVVRLCSIECSFAQTLANGEQNRSFRDDIQGWSKMADRLFVWDYMTDFSLYLLPFPNYHVLKDNIQFYVDHNVVGLFEQGDYHGITGDFVQMRNWVVARLLWNPSFDQKELMKEFIAGYYAPELVEPYMNYFETLSNQVQKSNIHLGIFRTTTSDWLDFDSLNQATEYQNEALNIAEELERKNPTKYQGKLVKKVLRERIPLDLVWLQDGKNYQLEARLTGKKSSGPENLHKTAIEFGKRLDENGLTGHREHVDAAAFESFKQELINANPEPSANIASDIPDFCRKLDLSNWLEIQECDLNCGLSGNWTFLVDDENASNKRAVKMPNTHFEWATTWNVNRFLSMLCPVSDANSISETVSGDNSESKSKSDSEMKSELEMKSESELKQKVDSASDSDSSLVQNTSTENIDIVVEKKESAVKDKAIADNEKSVPEYHVYAFVRAEGNVNSGVGMTLGIYDRKAKKSVVHRAVPLEEINGKDYKTIDLGVFPLTSTQYFWAAPPDRKDRIDAVYVDRIIFVREK